MQCLNGHHEPETIGGGYFSSTPSFHQWNARLCPHQPRVSQRRNIVPDHWLQRDVTCFRRQDRTYAGNEIIYLCPAIAVKVIKLVDKSRPTLHFEHSLWKIHTGN